MNLMNRRNLKISVITVLIVLTSLTEVRSQFSVNSPYSRYGLGSINSGLNQTNVSLGGTGYAFARNSEVNFLNPASFNAIEQQSFVFNMGFNMSWENYKTSSSSSDAFVGSVSNISLAFPVYKGLKLGLSLTPFTDINYSATDTVRSFVNYMKSFTGKGGLDKFTVSASYGLIDKEKDRLAVGVNASYFFGNIYRSTGLTFLTDSESSSGILGDTTGFLDNTTEINYNVSSFGFDFGIQYFRELTNGNNLGFGAVFTPSYSLSADKRQIFYTSYRYGGSQYLQDTLSYNNEDAKIKMPMKIGFGVSFERPNKLFAETDFTYTQWSKFDMETGNNNELKDNFTVNAGLEYIPDLSSTLYYKKIAYRVGIHFDNGFVYLNGKRISDYGISFGTALPIKKLGTRINLSFQYGKRGNVDNNLAKEDYFRIGLSISAKDRWFVKRKYL